MGVYKGIAQDNVTITSGTATLGTVSTTGLATLNSLTVSGLAMFNGAFELSAPVTKTADFTVGNAETFLICNKSGSSCTVTLPAAASWIGRLLFFKTIQSHAVVSASSNVAPANSATPGTAITGNSAGNWSVLVSDGTNWVVMLDD